MTVDPISLGITIALTAASMALTASQHYEGPRVADLKATSADYGTPLTNFTGNRIFNCPVFWAEPLVDRERHSKSKGGKMTTHYATGTCAVHVADHQIGRVTRIWADEHLVYDADGTTKTFQFGDDYDLGSHLRFYTGTADQEPDHRMQATIEAQHGPGTCPAYRHQSYFVIEDAPFDLIGNRYPQWRVEAETGDLVTFPIDTKVSLPFPLPRNINPASPQPQVELFINGTMWNDNIAYVTFNWILDIDTTDTSLHTQTFTIDTGTFTVQYQFHATATENYVQTHITVDETDLGWTYRTLAFYPHVYGDNVAPWNTKAFKSTVTNLATGTSAVADFDPSTEWFYSATYDQWMYQGDVWANSPEGTQPDFYRYISSSTTLGGLLTSMSLQSGLTSDEFNYSDLDQIVRGFSWTQGSIKQIAGYLLDAYDSDIVPHDFKIVGKKRGMASLGSIATAEMVAGEDRYTLPYTNDRDLPRNIYFNFADFGADQNPNTAAPSARLTGATMSVRELSVDATSLAMTVTEAKQSVDRYHRRTWFGRTAPEFGLTLQRLAIEPGDVWTPDFDGVPIISRITKTSIGAAGVIKMEAAQDDPVLAGLSDATGAPADGHVPSTIFDPAETTADVLDLPLLTDAHDQAAPFAYVLAGPAENKAWTGAIFSQSDTGEADSFVFSWDSISSSAATIFGETTGALNAVDAGVFDNGSAVSVTIDSGTLTSTTDDDLLNDGTRNLAAIKSVDGYELVQFRTATLTAPLTYTLTGFLRGVRGTEAHIAGHATGDRFVLLGNAKVHTLGAGEIGDTDSYIATTTGQIPSDSNVFARAFTAAAHRPYSPVGGSITDSGSDKLIAATRRTRIGGATLNGQDVPLGEASEAWQADIFDGSTFVRTLPASGNATSLPITYGAADIAADAVSDLVVKLYQIDPTLNLRGSPLTITG